MVNNYDFYGKLMNFHNKFLVDPLYEKSLR